MTAAADDELELTVETLIDLDEPEALLRTLFLAADRRKGPRWRALATVLAKAEEDFARVLEPPKPKVEPLQAPTSAPADEGVDP